jgi:hypothetical protein
MTRTPSQHRAYGNEKRKQIQRLLTKAGWLCQKDSQKVIWIPDKAHPGRRRPVSMSADLFGTIDIAALRPDQRTLLIQAGTDANPSKKRRDLEDNLIPFIGEHHRVQLWFWGRFVIGPAWRVEEWVGDWETVAYVRVNGVFTRPAIAHPVLRDEIGRILEPFSTTSSATAGEAHA